MRRHGRLPAELSRLHRRRRPAAAETKPEPVGKDGGEFCEEDSECKSNRCSSDNKCTEYEGEKKGPKLWIGIAGALDYTFVPSADDVCKLSQQATPLNDANYYCTRSDGTDYPSRDPQGGRRTTRSSFRRTADPTRSPVAVRSATSA